MKSSRRLEHETLRNVEVTWLPGRLSPDHKTIADFRKDNGEAIREVCVRFVDVCRQIRLLTVASVAIEGLKFEAVNNRDRNFTKAKMQRRKDQIATSVAHYLEQLDRTDRQEPSPAMEARKVRLSEKISELEEEMQQTEEHPHRNGAVGTRLKSHAGDQYSRRHPAHSGNPGGRSAPLGLKYRSFAPNPRSDGLTGRPAAINGEKRTQQVTKPLTTAAARKS